MLILDFELMVQLLVYTFFIVLFFHFQPTVENLQSLLLSAKIIECVCLCVQTTLSSFLFFSKIFSGFFQISASIYYNKKTTNKKIQNFNFNFNQNRVTLPFGTPCIFAWNVDISPSCSSQSQSLNLFLIYQGAIIFHS